MKKFWRILLICTLVMGLAAVGGCTNGSGTTSDVDQDGVSFEGQTLSLFVAAGMKKPMDETIASFEEKTGATVAVNYGSSGELFAQIKVGQPCDLFYSADWLYIEELEEIDKVEEEDKFLNDCIVLVTSETGKNKVKKLEDLANEGVTMVIADPQAPVGIYAKNSLENLGLWDKVSPNIKAMPSTVNQVAIMVKKDQVDAGLIYSSVANGNQMEIIETVDNEISGEIIFGSAVIKGGNTELGKAFSKHANENVSVFERFGYKAYE